MSETDNRPLPERRPPTNRSLRDEVTKLTDLVEASRALIAAKTELVADAQTDDRADTGVTPRPPGPPPPGSPPKPPGPSTPPPSPRPGPTPR
jgi:hypothetical protein